MAYALRHLAFNVCVTLCTGAARNVHRHYGCAFFMHNLLYSFFERSESIT
jgi:hypothetical protein